MRSIIGLACLACLADHALAQAENASMEAAQKPIASPAQDDAADVVAVPAADGALSAVALIELLGAEDLSCEFGPISMVNWTDEEPQPVAPNWSWETVNYSAISIRDGTAKGGDTWVKAEVRIIPTNRGIHLYAIDDEGSLSIATVSASRGSDGRYQAVLSRHMGTENGPNPAQSYGFCTR